MIDRNKRAFEWFIELTLGLAAILVFIKFIVEVG